MNVAADGTLRAVTQGQETITVTFSVYGSNDKLLYSWSIDGKQISNPNLSVDLGVAFSCKDKSPIDQLTNQSNCVYLTFNHTGTLPGPVKMEVFVGDKFKDGDLLNLYYYNESTDKPELISTQLKVSSGYAEFTITHCSQYFLTAKTILNQTGNPKTGGSQTATPIVFTLGISFCTVIGLALLRKRKLKFIQS